MPEHHIAAEEKQKQFVTKVVQEEKVWGLHCNEGWSNADSCELENTVVYPFWPSDTSAKTCAVDEWGVYSPKSLPLSEFLENWCVGMYKEFILAGIDWDANLEGGEMDTIDLALQIVQELKKQNKELQFTLYKNQNDFEQMLLDVIEEERKTLN